ncbi:Membrane associated serine protease, rhomboid family [Natronoarchaeum philippinense]|uniref:Membrane associated serine protease, rhomboid family n=1 Tax=Natronoarchaeum philippinense TaxID=558529 RepID=A0A285N647_NATPI|nr:rhomboid family intramembrane serine protease [Natronoarchaeum philippinense]SNZ04889.1 Membrane associated serine protease, rhomboid family [Natronoarchaeum philippinense]
MNLLSAGLVAAVVVLIALSAVAIIRADRPGGAWGRRLRSRLLLGVPWGTIVSVLFVLAVYLFVQRGYWHWTDPVTIPFRSWSYLYPTGWLTSGFAHAGPGHLRGNLQATIVLAPIVEYAWGHLPQERGSQSFASWRTNPWLRAFVLFPAAVLGVGLLTSLFALGPVIGFSGVVFAFAGFALVHYPVATIVALLVSSVISTVVSSLVDPIVTATVSASPPSAPSWAGIAIQGHALGLFLGLVLGLAVLYRREGRPSAARVWLAALVFAVVQGLWAVYWFRGGGTYVLYRGVGVALVLLLALLVTLAAVASERPLISGERSLIDPLSPLQTALSLALIVGLALVAYLGLGPPFVGSASVAVVITVALRILYTVVVRIAGSGRWAFGGITRRHVAITAVLLGVALLAGPAVVPNLVTVGDDAVPEGETVTVEDYTIAYGEEVPNRMVSAIDISAFGETTQINTSGVIVINEDRHIWARQVSPQQLAYSGAVRLRLGGVGWSESVVVRREGWTAVGNGTAYQVWLDAEDTPTQHAFDSAPQTATPSIDGRTVTVVPDDGEFYLGVERGNESLGRTALPEVGETESVGRLLFSTERRDGRAVVVAERGGTSVAVARHEQYR